VEGHDIYINAQRLNQIKTSAFAGDHANRAEKYARLLFREIVGEERMMKLSKKRDGDADILSPKQKVIAAVKGK
jgi:hypothetical protein